MTPPTNPGRPPRRHRGYAASAPDGSPARSPAQSAIRSPTRSLPRLLAAAAAGAMLVPAALPAQTSLGRPLAVFPEDFGSIQTVRELSDGRLLVADPLAKALYLVDMAQGRRRQVGSEGQGPEEYRQPDAVWALTGDSTLLVDLGNARLVRLGPDLAFGATRPIAQGDFQPGRPLVLAIPQGVDASGAVYFRGMPREPGQAEAPDSAEILRLPPGAAAPTAVARFKLPDQQVTRSGSANNQNTSISPLPLTPEDAWGVAEDGAVVIARSRDYHVEWIGPDGRRRAGPPVRWDPVRVGSAEKEEYLAEQGRGGGIAVSLTVENGRPSLSMQRGGGPGQGARDAARYTWPDRLPPFYGGRIAVDRQGRAWVRRRVAAGAPATYDLFDRTGARVATLALEPGRRVVGFGAASVYVVAHDEFDLAYLERYALPRI